jgi:hypothetical protein
MGLTYLQKLNAKRTGYTPPGTPDDDDKLPEPVSKGALDKWFKTIRNALTGHCQCGCGAPSSKLDDKYYKYSIAHIFPKKAFPSVAIHPENFVERAFFGGCHTNMDKKGLSSWPNMADWQTIRRKFFILERFLTKAEKAKKFYTILKKLVDENP